MLHITSRFIILAAVTTVLLALPSGSADAQFFGRTIFNPPVPIPPPTPPLIIIQPINWCAMQTQSSEASYPFAFGDSEVGVSGDFSAETFRRPECNDGSTTQPASASYEVSADIDVQLLGGSYNALHAEASADNTGGNSTAHAELLLGGYTIYSDTDASLVLWEAGDSITLVEVSTVVFVGPVPVTLSVSLGVGYGASVTLEASIPVRITGAIGAWASGTGGVGVGFPCVNVSLQAELQILNTEIQATLEIFPDIGSGSIALVFEPLNVILKLCAELCPFGEACLTITEWSVAQFEHELLSF